MKLESEQPAGELGRDRVGAGQNRGRAMFGGRVGGRRGVRVRLRYVSVALAVTERCPRRQHDNQLPVRVFRARVDELHLELEMSIRRQGEAGRGYRDRSFDGPPERAIDVTERDVGALHGERQRNGRRVQSDGNRSGRSGRRGARRLRLENGDDGGGTSEEGRRDADDGSGASDEAENGCLPGSLRSSTPRRTDTLVGWPLAVPSSSLHDDQEHGVPCAHSGFSDRAMAVPRAMCRKVRSRGAPKRGFAGMPSPP